MGELSVKKKGRKSIYKLSLEENEDIIASLSSSNAKWLAISYFLLSFQPFMWWNDKYIILPHLQRIVGTSKIGFNHTNNVNILYCIIVLCIWHKIGPINSLKKFKTI